MPNAQRKTELNWTELNCSVQFSTVSRCALNRRRPATTGDGRRRFVDGRRRFLTVENLRRPSSVVAARRWFNTQRKTELNSSYSTELNLAIQFSSVFRCVLGFKGLKRPYMLPRNRAWSPCQQVCFIYTQFYKHEPFNANFLTLKPCKTNIYKFG